MGWKKDQLSKYVTLCPDTDSLLKHCMHDHCEENIVNVGGSIDQMMELQIYIDTMSTGKVTIVKWSCH